MEEKGKGRKATSGVRKHAAMIRLGEEALEWVRIAAGYTGESTAEYATRVLAKQAKADADRLHDRKKKEGQP